MNNLHSGMVLAGSGAVLLLASVILLMNNPWNLKTKTIGEWLGKPISRAGVICLALSGILIAAAAVPLLS